MTPVFGFEDRSEICCPSVCP